MSNIQPDEIIVDFNLSKKEINHDVIEEVKPKAKNEQVKKIILLLKML